MEKEDLISLINRIRVGDHSDGVNKGVVSFTTLKFGG